MYCNSILKMSNKKILAISFYGSTKHQLIPYKNLEFVDTVAFETNKLNAGIPGTIEEFEKLNIDYNKYFAVITWGDSLFPVIEYFFKKCITNKITIYGNQHGVNKSIIQILFSSPNLFCKYWNAEGTWMLNRFSKVLKTDPICRRWISIGSTYHEYLYNKYLWDSKRANNKILVIHEPNLKHAEGDKFPHDSEMIINEIIRLGKKLGFEIDLKVHPNWKGRLGNNGEEIARFNCNYVDIQFADVLKYSLVVGSRSSLLYESYLTGIPVFAVESFSEWPDDCISFFDLKLISVYPIIKIEEGILTNINKPGKRNFELIEKLSGPIRNGVLNKYLDFIVSDNENPDKIFGTKIYNKYLTKIKESDKKNNYYLKFLFIKIVRTFPKSFQIIKHLTKI